MNCHKPRVICNDGHWFQNDGNDRPIEAPFYICEMCTGWHMSAIWNQWLSLLSFILLQLFPCGISFFFSYQVATYSGYFIIHQFLFILYYCSLFLSGVRCFGYMLGKETEAFKRNWIRKQICLSQSPKTNLQLTWWGVEKQFMPSGVLWKKDKV